MTRYVFIILAVALSVLAGCSNSDDPSGDAGGTDTGGDTDTDSDSDSDSDTDSDADTDTYDNTGICGTEGEATVSLDSYDGTEDRYIVGDEGYGEDVCRVSYELHSIGEAPAPCEMCEWALTLEISNPAYIADVDGVCASSELNLDDSALAELDGKTVGYGWVEEYVGHSSVLMQYDWEAEVWEAVGFASWNEDTGELVYDRKEGYCGY